jgi:hypothetical protein
MPLTVARPLRIFTAFRYPKLYCLRQYVLHIDKSKFFYTAFLNEALAHETLQTWQLENFVP